MNALLLVLTAAAAVTMGCAPVIRSTGAAPYPRSGTYLQYAADGRLMQKTVWRDGKLRSAWQVDRKGRWVRGVTAGNGHALYFDQEGSEIGFAEYFRGEYRRGAH